MSLRGEKNSITWRGHCSAHCLFYHNHISRHRNGLSYNTFREHTRAHTHTPVELGLMWFQHCRSPSLQNPRSWEASCPASLWWSTTRGDTDVMSDTFKWMQMQEHKPQWALMLQKKSGNTCSFFLSEIEIDQFDQSASVSNPDSKIIHSQTLHLQSKLHYKSTLWRQFSSRNKFSILLPIKLSFWVICICTSIRSVSRCMF